MLVAFCMFLLFYHDHFVCIVVMSVCSTCFCAVFIFSVSDRKHQHNQFPGKTRLKEDQLCIQRNINSADSHHNSLVLSTCQHTASLTKSTSQIYTARNSSAGVPQSDTMTMRLAKQMAVTDDSY